MAAAGGGGINDELSEATKRYAETLARLRVEEHSSELIKQLVDEYARLTTEGWLAENYIWGDIDYMAAEAKKRGDDLDLSNMALLTVERRWSFLDHLTVDSNGTVHAVITVGAGQMDNVNYDMESVDPLVNRAVVALNRDFLSLFNEILAKSVLEWARQKSLVQKFEEYGTDPFKLELVSFTDDGVEENDGKTHAFARILQGQGQDLLATIRITYLSEDEHNSTDLRYHARLPEHDTWYPIDTCGAGQSGGKTKPNRGNVRKSAPYKPHLLSLAPGITLLTHRDPKTNALLHFSVPGSNARIALSDAARVAHDMVVAKHGRFI